jgi:hypothetical protein
MYGQAQSFTRIFVIGIIAMLIAVLLPVLSRVRQQSLAVRCAANLQQMSIAFNNYLTDAPQKKFWRSANPSLDGMDWYAYGGQEMGGANIGQAGLFNAVGQPNLEISPERGLAGVQFTQGRDASHTILFSENAAIYSAVSHAGGKTKLALADGHVVCVDLNASVKAGEMRW